MKPLIKLAVVAAFSAAALLGSWVQASPEADELSEAASPRSLYLQNCARCHGSSGRANTTEGRQLEAADLTSPEIKGKSSASITRTIKNGRMDMPAFGKKLTPVQIASLVKYVRTL